MRDDLAGRLPIVYNGRSVEEWYGMYCQASARLAALEAAAKAVVEVWDANGDSLELARPIGFLRLALSEALDQPKN